MKITKGRTYKNIVSLKEITVDSVNDNTKIITVNDEEIPKKYSYSIEYFQKYFVPSTIAVDDNIIVTSMGRIIKIEKINIEEIRSDDLLCIDNAYLSRFPDPDFSLKQVGFSPNACEYRFIYDEKVKELRQKNKVINKLYEMRDFLEEEIGILERKHSVSLEEVKEDIENFMDNEERGY